MKARVLKGGAVYLNGTLYIPTTSASQYKVIDYKEECQYKHNDIPRAEQSARSKTRLTDGFEIRVLDDSIEYE